MSRGLLNEFLFRTSYEFYEEIYYVDHKALPYEIQGSLVSSNYSAMNISQIDLLQTYIMFLKLGCIKINSLR